MGSVRNIVALRFNKAFGYILKKDGNYETESLKPSETHWKNGFWKKWFGDP